jgi:chain length determinant protein tyrosine kinase EpsG
MNANEKVVQLDSSAHGGAPLVAAHPKCLGALLVSAGKISSGDAERIMALQRREGLRFGEAALRLSLISERDLVSTLHKQYDLPTLSRGIDRLGDELIAALAPYHRRTEELRSLRTQLLIRWFRRPSAEQQVLAIVSPEAGEGRSYVAANLAVLFSQLGERTLLIDGDLRRPRQHEIFNRPDRIGLSTVLAGRADATVAQAIPGIQNLVLLPAGAPPPNPLELLSRPVFPALLKTYARDFDVILVDTPPALEYSDAQTIGFRAGSAMVLAHRGHTEVANVHRVMRQLGDGGTRVIGTVLNEF